MLMSNHGTTNERIIFVLQFYNQIFTAPFRKLTEDGLLYYRKFEFLARTVSAPYFVSMLSNCFLINNYRYN